MSEPSSLFHRLAKTRASLGAGLSRLLGRGTVLDAGLYEDIEDQLIMSDLGVETSQAIVTALRRQAKARHCATPDQLRAVLYEIILGYFDTPGSVLKPGDSPIVIVFVGVNGVGKTTTAAKLAAQLKARGHTVMLAACDTFRAAAVEQLQDWGHRLHIPVIAQSHGADAAAVAFDAATSARAREMDYLLIDTAGRQHTKADLMEQLKKLVRALNKADEDAPQETWLIVDGGSGQNVLSQLEHFNQHTSLTGVCVTKLDGTAKGGVLIAMAEKYKIPVRYIGVGEGVDDLRQFNPEEFVAALLPVTGDADSD